MTFFLKVLFNLAQDGILSQKHQLESLKESPIMKLQYLQGLQMEELQKLQNMQIFKLMELQNLQEQQDHKIKDIQDLEDLQKLQRVEEQKMLEVQDPLMELVKRSMKNLKAQGSNIRIL